MVHSLFETATSVRVLEAAWEKCRSNRGCAGGDGVTIDAFQHSSAVRLIQLSRDLRSGAYRPGPLRRAAIPKDDGSERVLMIPTVTDRIAQGAVSSILMPVLDRMFSDSSYAYRPGRSVDQAVRAVTRHRQDGFEWVAESDVEACFDRIAHDPLHDALAAAIGKRKDADMLLDLVALWTEDWGQTFGTPGRGVAQGSPLSPLLANLALDGADDALDAAAGARLVRFADDFVILCRGRDRAEKALDKMREALERVGLTLNPEKTRIASFDHGVRFLGRLFVRSLVMKEEHLGEDETSELMRLLAGKDADSEAEELDAEAAEERDRRAGLDAGARTLYIEQADRRLAIDDGSIVVSQQTEAGWSDILRLAPNRVDRIELAPGIQAGLAQLADLAELGIPVHLLDAGGETRATLAPPLPLRAALHLDQARTSLDPDAAADLARRYIDGRIHNQRSLLRKLNRKPKLDDVSDVAAKLSRVKRKLTPNADVATVMEIEAEAGGLYWPALRALVQDRWAVKAGKRTRQPPLDGFNAVVSYLTALAHREVLFAVRRAGLHPGFGTLHASRDHADACAFDLIEEFRAPLTEGPAVYLFNASVLQRGNFLTARSGGIRINGKARGEIIRTFRRTLETPFKNPWTERQTTWGGMLLHQARALAHHHRGSRAYEPYRVDN